MANNQFLEINVITERIEEEKDEKALR